MWASTPLAAAATNRLVSVWSRRRTLVKSEESRDDYYMIMVIMVDIKMYSGVHFHAV